MCKLDSLFVLTKPYVNNCRLQLNDKLIFISGNFKVTSEMKGENVVNIPLEYKFIILGNARVDAQKSCYYKTVYVHAYETSYFKITWDIDLPIGNNIIWWLVLSK